MIEKKEAYPSHLDKLLSYGLCSLPNLLLNKSCCYFPKYSLSISKLSSLKTPAVTLGLWWEW